MRGTVPHSESDARYIRNWTRLYERVCHALSRFGEEEPCGLADYWVFDDYWGYPQVKVYLTNLAMLRPEIITTLQRLLTASPGWEIIVAVSIRGAGESWPNMGLTIREDEIVDRLPRIYSPPEFQGFQYEGSRPGTERD